MGREGGIEAEQKRAALATLSVPSYLFSASFAHAKMSKAEREKKA